MRLDLNPDRLIPELARYQRQLLIAGGAGAAVSLVGLFVDRRQFFQSYLMTFMLLLGATLGIARARHDPSAVGRRLGRGHAPHLRRGVARAAGPDPALSAAASSGLHDLYEWTHHDVVEADPDPVRASRDT